jgi:hypothetical protein
MSLGGPDIAALVRSISEYYDWTRGLRGNSGALADYARRGAALNASGVKGRVSAIVTSSSNQNQAAASDTAAEADSHTVEMG